MKFEKTNNGTFRISFRPEREKAKHSGICPMCHVYTSKNWSWVMPLPEPMKPRHRIVGEIWLSADTGHPYSFHGEPITTHPREYVHERCYDKAIAARRNALPNPEERHSGRRNAARGTDAELTSQISRQ